MLTIQMLDKTAIWVDGPREVSHGVEVAIVNTIVFDSGIVIDTGMLTAQEAYNLYVLGTIEIEVSFS